MSYWVCLGKKERYGNTALASGGSKIYKDFRFRDPWCIDTGRTKNETVVGANFSEWIMTVSTVNIQDEIVKYTDANGLVWHPHEGNKPDDTQFTRHPHGYNIDSRPDRWSFGVQTKEKIPHESVNMGYYQSSTWKKLKENGQLQ